MLKVQWNFASICFKLVGTVASVPLLLTVYVTLGKSTSWHEKINRMHVRIQNFAAKTSSLVYMQWA